MNELQHLIAFINFCLCVPSFVICICRLNAMDSKTVLWRVQAEYALGAGALFFSAFRPLIGEWPGYASLLMAAYVLWMLIASGHAWKNDKPPEVATDHSPLSEEP